MADKLKLLCCGHFRREAETVLTGKTADGVSISFFESRCGRPPITWREISSRHIRFSEDEHLLIIGGCCLAEIKELTEKNKHCRIHYVEQCFYLFADRKVIDEFIKEGAYLLTSGWLKQWRDLMDIWRFDRQTARSFFRESAGKLVLLDTWVDQKSRERLHEFATFVDLPTETFRAGLDFFRLFIKNLICEWRHDLHRQALTADLRKCRQQSADLAMALDLLGQLSQSSTENQAIDGVIELFTMIFAPGDIRFLPLSGDRPGKDPADDFPVPSWKQLKKNGYAVTENGNGFWLLFHTQRVPLGILKIDRIAFPAFLKQYLNLALSIISVCGLVVNNVRTTQGLRESEKQIAASLREKEVLLREVHHRVKNNMQIISSLLSLQADYVKNDTDLSVFRESRDRINAMASIHEKLYRSENIGDIRFGEYVKTFVYGLFSSYGIDPARTKLVVEMDDITLGIELAIPCGLIVNELVSNALKYAFPDGREGEIRISLQTTSDNGMELTVTDNGIGLPETLDFKETESLGLHLVTILVEGQLDGEIELDRRCGASFHIRFNR